MDKSARFWNRIAERYAERPISDQASYQAKLDITRRYLTPEMHVLEIACGTGSTAILHAPHVARIDATDIAPNMIEIAKARCGEAEVDNVRPEVASLDEIAASGRKYDAVLALNFLHLSHDLDTAVAQCRSLLKPGGVFISNTACISGGWRLLRPLLWIGAALGRLPRLKFFGAERLKRSIARAGFEIVETWRPRKGPTLFIVAKATD